MTNDDNDDQSSNLQETIFHEIFFYNILIFKQVTGNILEFKYSANSVEKNLKIKI